MSSHPPVPIPCSVRVSAPAINRGTRANLTWTLDFDESSIVLNIPDMQMTLRVVMVGDHTDELLRRASELIEVYRSTVCHEDTNENAPCGPELAAPEGTFSTNLRSESTVSETDAYWAS